MLPTGKTNFATTSNRSSTIRRLQMGSSARFDGRRSFNGLLISMLGSETINSGVQGIFTAIYSEKGKTAIHRGSSFQIK